MKKRILSLLLALMMVVLLLPVTALAAETGIDTSALDMEYYGRYKDKGYSISVYNCGEYISDGADGGLDVNKAFEEVTGIRVIYSNYDTNESMYAKLKTGGAVYDIVVPSDYMISRMIAEGMLQKLDMSNIPNLKNIDEKYLYQSYDPTNEYSVPYTWGVLGLIYNTQMVEDEAVVASWGALWSEAYMDNILMINNSKATLLASWPIIWRSTSTAENGQKANRRQPPDQWAGCRFVLPQKTVFWGLTLPRVNGIVI